MCRELHKDPIAGKVPHLHADDTDQRGNESGGKGLRRPSRGSSKPYEKRKVLNGVTRILSPALRD